MPRSNGHTSSNIKEYKGRLSLPLLSTHTWSSSSRTTSNFINSETQNNLSFGQQQQHDVNNSEEINSASSSRSTRKLSLSSNINVTSSTNQFSHHSVNDFEFDSPSSEKYSGIELNIESVYKLLSLGLQRVNMNKPDPSPTTHSLVRRTKSNSDIYYNYSNLELMDSLSSCHQLDSRSKSQSNPALPVKKSSADPFSSFIPLRRSSVRIDNHIYPYSTPNSPVASSIRSNSSSGIPSPYSFLSTTSLTSPSYFGSPRTSSLASLFNFNRSTSEKENLLWSILHNMDLEENILDRIAQICIEVDNRHGEYTPLLWTCWKIHGEVTLPLVRLLIERGANVNATDGDGLDGGWNALHYLCRYYNGENLKELAEALMTAGVDVNAKTRSGFNALHLLCCYQTCAQLEDVIQLFLIHKIDVNAKTNKGFTALHFLCRNYPHPSLLGIINLLLYHGANVQAINRGSWTAMHFLCRFYKNDNLLDIVRLLAERDVGQTLFKVRTANGQNALECALLNSSGWFHDLFEFVRENRRDFSPVWRAQTLLDLAKIGCIPMVKFFVNQNTLNGGIYNVTDAYGKNCHDYLMDVCENSLSLCRKCRMIGRRDDEAEVLKSLERQLIRREKFHLPFPPFVKEQLYTCISDQSDCVVSKEKCFVSFPEYEEWQNLVNIWHSEIESIDFNPFDRYIRKNSHMNCKGEQLDNCSWCRISGDVKAYLHALLLQVKALDPRMESDQLIGYGSAAELSNLFLPDEFDFAVVLKHFRQSEPDYPKVSYGGTDSNELPPQPFRSNGSRPTISSGRLLSYYGLLVEEAIRRVPWHRYVFYPRVTISETCVTLTFYYRSTNYKGHQISVDLTVAVSTITSYSNSNQLDWYQTFENCAQFIVPDRSNECGNRWQFSTFLIEKETFLRPECRGVVTHVFRLLKLMLCLNQVKPEERMFCRKGHPSTYALKTCLFHYMMKESPPWAEKDIIRHCRNVLDFFPIEDKELASFFRDDVCVYYTNYAAKKTVQQVAQKLNRCVL